MKNQLLTKKLCAQAKVQPQCLCQMNDQLAPHSSIKRNTPYAGYGAVNAPYQPCTFRGFALGLLWVWFGFAIGKPMAEP